MVLKLIEENKPLTKVVNFDEGMNFESVKEMLIKLNRLLKNTEPN